MKNRLIGFGAALGILLIVAGVPYLLTAIGANPIPSQLPTWADIAARLTAPDDGTAIAYAFTVFAWAAWAYITIAILVEIPARLRGLRAPRLPGFRLPQHAARGLVSTAALLFAVAPLTAHAEPLPASPPLGSHAQEATPKKAAKTADSCTVRDGDSLWSIAEDELGGGERWREIAELNYGRAQPDGHRLTNQHWLNAGWKLQLPADDKTDKPPPTRVTSHKVKPGETLWSIAADKLGDGDRYPEIFAASRTNPQPGGARIVDPDEIGAGWTVKIPATAKASAKAGPDADARADTKNRGRDATQTDPPADQPTPQPQTSRAPSADPSTPRPSATIQPTAEAPPAPTQAPADLPAPDTATDLDDDEAKVVVMTASGVGALLAAGVIGLIAVRRRQQQRHRRPGRRIPMPTTSAAATEQQLRATADPLSVEIVDVALRQLASNCATAGNPLPTVRAARLAAEQFDLYLTEPATLPAPWTGTVDATVWTLLADQADQVDPAARHLPAPYPALVTIGHDPDGGHVFLDLEYLGALGLTGDPDLSRQVLAAIAIELATSSWADDLQVTVVGAYPELEEALQTGRIRYLPSVGRVLAELDTRAAADRAALTDADMPDLQHARIAGAAPDAWTPEIVLLAGPLTDLHRNQLDHLLEQLPRVAIAAVTSNTTVGEWQLNLTDDGNTAVLEPIGLTIRPQRIDPDTYAHILESVAIASTDLQPGHDTADQMGDTTAITTIRGSAADLHLEEPDPPQLTADPAPAAGPSTPIDPAETEDAASETAQQAADLPQDPSQAASVTTTADQHTGPDDDHDIDPPAAAQPLPTRHPYIQVLGPVDISHAHGPLEPSKRSRLLEYAAYLALHNHVTHTSIDDAIWPSRTNEDNLNTRNTATSKLRSWLGKNPDGDPYLPRHSYVPAAAVRTDWHDWTELVGSDPAAATTTRLEQAMALVRGRPFEGVHPRRYAWAEPLRQEMLSSVADVAYEIAHRRLLEGKWRAAEEAAALGITLEPGLERMWRIRILAAHESRDRQAEREAIDRLLVISDELGGDLEPETQQLLAALQDPRSEFDELKEAL